MTDKQRIFVDNYLSCGYNATQAAISAGYSQKTAYSIGERLLRNVEIRSAIDERLKEIESEQICKAEEILKFLSSVVRGKISDNVSIQVGTGKGYFHGENMNKPPSLKDQLMAAATLAKFFKVGEEQEQDNELRIVIVPAKNPRI